MTTMVDALARHARWACLEPIPAARSLWAEAPDPVMGQALLAFALVSDDELASYEATEPDRLVRGRWGQFWLCAVPPVEWLGQSPWVTLRAMRALGRGLAEALSEEPAALDLTANDFGD